MDRVACNVICVCVCVYIYIYIYLFFEPNSTQYYHNLFPVMCDTDEYDNGDKIMEN